MIGHVHFLMSQRTARDYKMKHAFPTGNQTRCVTTELGPLAMIGNRSLNSPETHHLSLRCPICPQKATKFIEVVLVVIAITVQVGN